MHRIRALIVAMVSALALAMIPASAGEATISAVSAGSAADKITVPFHTAVANLRVEDEVRTGYDRDLFKHWIDADGDGCNTRYEVLIAEATTPPDVGSGCKLSGGGWHSYFDGRDHTNPADLDIDHFVPLAEAWDSGARNWTSGVREAFANDLGDDRTLAAVTDSVNQNKSDQDPADWLPPDSSAQCRYLTEWTVAKTRWNLAADDREKSKLTSLAANCPNEELTIELANGGGDPGDPPGDCDPVTNSAAKAIPDPGTLKSTVSVSGCTGKAAATSKITVDITHSYRGDISIYLFAPDGTYYPLKRSDGDSSNDIKTDYTANLSSETANGTWTLSVRDYYDNNDAGTLNSWALAL